MGRLIEIPSEYSLVDTFEFEKYRNQRNSPRLKLYDLEELRKVAIIRFKTPDGSNYELRVCKTERSPFHGHFKKI